MAQFVLGKYTSTMEHMGIFKLVVGCVQYDASMQLEHVSLNSILDMSGDPVLDFDGQRRVP